MRTDSDTLIDAGKKLAQPIQLDGAAPFILQGGKVVTLEHLLERPHRARGVFRASGVKSLAEFISAQRGVPLDTAAFWWMGRLTVFLNFNTSADLAGWCDYKATCWCSYQQACNNLNTKVLKGRYKL